MMSNCTFTICSNVEILSSGYRLDDLEGRCEAAENAAMYIYEESLLVKLLDEHCDLNIVLSHLKGDSICLEYNGHFKDWRGGKFYHTTKNRASYGGVLHVACDDADEIDEAYKILAWQMVQAMCDTLSEAEKETQDGP